MSLDYIEIPFIDDWPPYSPELNVIEVVWAIMKKRIQKKKLFMIDDFKYEIIAVWVLSYIMRFFQWCVSKSGALIQFHPTFCIKFNFKMPHKNCEKI